ncbi:MAG: FAD-dependent oxidoreductase [Terracidiphilus sp.]
MSESWDVVIVGAGIVGAACALECASRGLRTAVVEAIGIGSGATAAGMGHIVVMDDSPAQLALTHYSQTLWQELSKRLPSDVEYEACGTLWVASDEEEMLEVRRKSAIYGSAGVHTEILDALMLAEAEPHLRKLLAGALLVRSDAVLYPPCAAGYLMQEAQRLGVQLYQRKVQLAKAGVVRLDDGTELQTAHIVIASGADACDLVPGLLIRKRKGHLAITDRYPGFVRHQLVELGYLKSAHSSTADSVAFNVQPRKTGQILIGSSRQFGAEDREASQQILSAMIQRARWYMPEIAGLSVIRVWTGFRAATPDKLPLIGPWPEDESLFLATGHEGLGITTSLGSARILVDYLLKDEIAIPIEPYLPGRFAKSVAHV